MQMYVVSSSNNIKYWEDLLVTSLNRDVSFDSWEFCEFSPRFSSNCVIALGGSKIGYRRKIFENPDSRIMVYAPIRNIEPRDIKYATKLVTEVVFSNVTKRLFGGNTRIFVLPKTLITNLDDERFTYNLYIESTMFPQTTLCVPGHPLCDAEKYAGNFNDLDTGEEMDYKVRQILYISDDFNMNLKKSYGLYCSDNVWKFECIENVNAL